MRFALPHLSCACALGRDNGEVLANLRRGVSPLVPLSGDIPGRTVLFGMVPGELPAIDDPEYDFRSCRLLLHAVRNGGGAFEALGSKGRYVDQMIFSTGYAWSGMVAALLANMNPIGAAAASVLLAGLAVGGSTMMLNLSIPDRKSVV